LTACPGPLVELQKSRRDAARKVIPKVTRWLKSQDSAPSILERVGGSSFAVSAKRTTSREEPNAMMFSQQPRRVPSRKQKKQWEREKKLFEQYVVPREQERKRASSGDAARSVTPGV
jgi:hypothetical protein